MFIHLHSAFYGSFGSLFLVWKMYDESLVIQYEDTVKIKIEIDVDNDDLVDLAREILYVLEEIADGINAGSKGKEGSD